MRLFLISFLSLMVGFCLHGQYSSVSFENSNLSSLKIVQIDLKEFSTLIHFQFTYQDSLPQLCIYENAYLQVKELDLSMFNSDSQNSNTKVDHKEYKLLNSYNLPLCDKVHVIDEEGQVFNFTLEFEKIPDNTFSFDIIDNANGSFYFKGIRINESKKNDYIDISAFINKTPVKELGFFYQDGSKVMYYNHKGITIAVELQIDNSYGKYYQAIILLQNLSGKDLNFFPDQVNSYLELNQGLVKAEILTYNEYMKKVRNRQTWSSLALSLSEGLAAASAGYSYSSSTASAYGYSNTNSTAYGSIGNTYGSAYGRSSTYSSAYGRSVTESFNGSEAYAASQNAANNIERYQNQQYEIKRIISDGYAKTNTIPNGSEYVCYINIKYIDANGLYLVIPFNDIEYYFWW